MAESPHVSVRPEKARKRYTVISPPVDAADSRPGWPQNVDLVQWEGAYSAVTCLVVIRSLTTHPFRDGAPFLLLTETPPTFGRPLRFFHILHRNFFAYLIPFAFRRLWWNSGVPDFRASIIREKQTSKRAVNPIWHAKALVYIARFRPTFPASRTLCALRAEIYPEIFERFLLYPGRTSNRS